MEHAPNQEPELNTAQENPFNLPEGDTKLERAAALNEKIAGLESYLNSLNAQQADVVRRKWAHAIGAVFIAGGGVTALIANGAINGMAAGALAAFFGIALGAYGGLPTQLQNKEQQVAEGLDLYPELIDKNMDELDSVLDQIRQDVDAQLIAGGAEYEEVTNDAGQMHQELRVTPEQVEMARQEMDK